MSERAATTAAENNIEHRAEQLRTESGRVPAGVVMLSYNWGSQQQVMAINEQLKERGYNTWYGQRPCI